VTNIRNTASPHWRGWLKPENRCLVPFNSFSEYAPEANPDTGKKDVVWFALNEDRPRAPSPASAPSLNGANKLGSRANTKRLSFPRTGPFSLRSSRFAIRTSSASYVHFLHHHM
jgi:hypothetical protein